jgi:tripartite-type tricarboxylate transporter receptor subunit TctC
LTLGGHRSPIRTCAERKKWISIPRLSEQRRQQLTTVFLRCIGAIQNEEAFRHEGTREDQEMKRLLRTLLLAAAVASMAVLVGDGRASAQDFAGRPIRIIVGVAAGGATDVTARIIAQKLSQSLKTPVIVEDRPGAFFEAAYRELMSSPPDGRTLFMISASTTVTQPGRKNFPYDIRKLSAIAEVSEGPFILTSNPARGFKTVSDLVAYGKAHPGKLTFGSGGGAASSLSLHAELLRLRAGVSIINVPYKGAANALTDVLGGQIDAMFDALPVEVEQVKSGKVTGLAVTSAKRSPALPDVPTMAEAGFKDFVTYNYFGLLGPPNVPPDIVKKIHDAVVQAVAEPDVVALFNKQGMTPVRSRPEDFAKMLAQDLERWTQVIKDAGIAPQ